MIPAIFGCKGHFLYPDEKSFFRDVKPAGFILFARNIDNPDQVRALTQELREVAGREDLLILIDQEGGRVQRLGPPHWRKYPPMARFGERYEESPEEAKRLLDAVCVLLGHDLVELGITGDCLPLLDLPQDGADPIIGDRAFSSKPDVVTELGRIVVDRMKKCGVLPVIKHIPGHGRALVDSHEALPMVGDDHQTLEAWDFKPFKALAASSPLAMTAHIIYSQIDADRPATQSPIVVEKVIRRHMGFDGLLMTDDLSMKALSGSFAERTKASLQAGCDLILHCNGDMAEMVEISSAVYSETEGLQERLAALFKDVGTVDQSRLEDAENLFRAEFS